MTRWALIGVFSVVGCLSFDSRSAEEIRILAVLPQPVGDADPVEVVLSDSVGWVEPGGGVRVWSEDGEPAAHELKVGPTDRSLILEPVTVWPSGSRMGLQLVEGLVRPDGRVWRVRSSTITLLRSVDPPAGPPRVERAVPVGPGPANLKRLGLNAHGLADDVGLYLDNGRERRPLRVEAGLGGRYRVVRPGVEPLSPGFWWLRSDRPIELGPGSLGSIEVVDGFDRVAPRLQELEAYADVDAIRVRIQADEPYFVRGEVRMVGSEQTVDLTVPPWFLRTGEVVVRTPVPEVDYAFLLRLVDFAGNERGVPLFVASAAPRMEVEITEIVTTPLHDWGDSEPAGLPFDPFPGRGAVTDTDEWVELVNRSERTVDLTEVSLQLHIVDGTPSVTEVVAAPALYFGAGGRPDAWLPGEAVVVRPRGAMSSREVEIRAVSGGRTLSAVRLGADGADHPGGSPPDPVHEAVARGRGGRWRWCVPGPGDPGRGANCVD